MEELSAQAQRTRSASRASARARRCQLELEEDSDGEAAEDLDDRAAESEQRARTVKAASPAAASSAASAPIEESHHSRRMRPVAMEERSEVLKKLCDERIAARVSSEIHLVDVEEQQQQQQQQQQRRLSGSFSSSASSSSDECYDAEVSDSDMQAAPPSGDESDDVLLPVARGAASPRVASPAPAPTTPTPLPAPPPVTGQELLDPFESGSLPPNLFAEVEAHEHHHPHDPNADPFAGEVRYLAHCTSCARVSLVIYCVNSQCFSLVCIHCA
jgi:hypothetical protein